MSRLVEALKMCKKSNYSYDWITDYVSTSDVVYEKIYRTIEELIFN